MRRGLFLFIMTLVTMISCTRNQVVVPLKNDPNIQMVFNNEDISNLNMIVKFFDNVIVKSTNRAGINKAYHEYFEKIAASESLGTIGNDIDSAKSPSLKALFDTLKKNEVFYEIWSRKHLYLLNIKPKIKKTDTVGFKLLPNLQGKYAKFLKLQSENDNLIKQYYGFISASGTIDPACIALFMGKYKNVDFSQPVNRLIWAVHYLTILYEEPYTTKR